MGIYFILLGIVSLITFLLYGLDKGFAKRSSRRIPEKVLILLAFFGGAFGAGIGMLVFHHKTRKPKFFILVPIAVVLWLFLTFLAIRFLP